MPGPGWMHDPSDPACVRWWDGEGWTEHRELKADWPDHAPPPPGTDRQPAFTAAPPTEPPLDFGATQATRVTKVTAVRPLPQPRNERYLAWPIVGLIAVPVVLVLLVVATLGGNDQDDLGTTRDTTTTVERGPDLEITTTTATADPSATTDPDNDDDDDEDGVTTTTKKGSSTTSTTKATGTTAGTTPTTRAPDVSSPPTSQPNMNDELVTEGSACSPEGSFGFTSTGTPMRCSGARWTGFSASPRPPG